VIAAYGARARRWAAGSACDAPTIAADEEDLLSALVDGVERRMRGERFALALFLDEDGNRFVRRWAAEIMADAGIFDARRRQCAAIAAGAIAIDGKSQFELGMIPPDAFGLARALWHLADAGVVVGEAAYSRTAVTFAHWHEARVAPQQGDATVPKPAGAREGAEHVVIWAGDRSADEIAIVLCALEELHLPVYVVCEGGGIPDSVHRCNVASSEPLLRSAAAIVDTTDYHPGTALALARFGVPLAVARTSGAMEVLDGASGYDPWNRDMVLAAVLEAAGRAAPQIRARSALGADGFRGGGPRAAERAPLVSVIVPTYNRRALLHRALASIAAQDYPSVETVVVNDAGENVRDIADEFDAVLVDRAENGGHAAVLNSGIERARGEYVAFLDDDDLFFPDHLSTLVAALERANGVAANSNSLIALRAEPDEVVGFSPGATSGVDIEESLVACPMLGMLACMIRRTVFRELGVFDETLVPNDDHELILRIALRHDWIHVNRVTGMHSMGGNYSHMSAVLAAKYPDRFEETYRRHAFPDRPLLAAKRRRFIDLVRVQGLLVPTVNARLPQPTRIVPAKA
jgi:glycosyltransferase involved in cell wall biosynthesis